MVQAPQARPKYLEIARYIRDQIARGDLQPGDEIPSERELASRWNVARPTATRALESLRSQGLVVSRRGAGTFVRRTQIAPRARERYERASELGTMYSDVEEVRFGDIGVVQAPPHVIESLNLPDKEMVVCRPRIIRNKETNTRELATSWFPAELAAVAPRLLRSQRIRGGTAAYIGIRTGRRPAYGQEQVAARLSTAEERRLLGMPRPSALLVCRVVIVDEDDRPMQFDEGCYPSGYWVSRQEYPIPSLIALPK